MLDVEGRVNVDTGIQQLFNVLIALGMPGAWHVGMSQLIYKSQLGQAAQDGIDIQLGELDAMVYHLGAWDDLEIDQQSLGLLTTMGFYVANHNIDTFGFSLVGGFQHGIGFSNASRITQEDLQAAALVLYFFSPNMG